MLSDVQEWFLKQSKKLALKTDSFDIDWRIKNSPHKYHAMIYPNKKWYCKHLVSAKNRKFKKEVDTLMGILSRD